MAEKESPATSTEPTEEQGREFLRGFLMPFADLCKEIAATRGQTLEELAAELEREGTR